MSAGQRRWVPRTSRRVATLLCAWLGVVSWPSVAHYVSLDSLVRPGALTFGVALTGKPFAYRAGGELRGFEIDVARAVAAAHGLELVLVRFSRDSLATALVDGAVDTINTLATPATGHRVAVVPYLVTGDHAMVLRGNPYRIRNIEDLSGRIVAATAGSSGERFAREIDARLVDAGLEPMVIHSFLETRHTPFPVSMGHASAFFAGTVRAVGLSQDQHSRTRLVEGLFRPQREAGFGVRVGNDDVRHALEHALAAMVATGKYDALRERFELTADLSPFRE